MLSPNWCKMNTVNKKIHDSATPAPGQQIITAVAFIHRVVDGTPQLFLAKRADTKAFLPGLYELPGGHIEFGEDLIEGLQREIAEELGVSIHVGDPFSAFTYLNKIKGSHSVQITFFATFVDDDAEPLLNPEDHSAAGWFSLEEMDTIKEQKLAPKEHVADASQYDPEWSAILKGFELLNTGKIDTGVR